MLVPLPKVSLLGNKMQFQHLNFLTQGREIFKYEFYIKYCRTVHIKYEIYIKYCRTILKNNF